jgi:DNA-binding MarR family transcriptional regulator
LLLRSLRQCERIILEQLQVLEFDDIRPTHLSILTHVPPDGIRTSEIALLANMTKQAVGQIATQLEEMGYIVRSPDPLDGRARIVEFTNKGQRLADASFLVLAQCEKRLEEMIGTDNLHLVKFSLKAVAETRLG